MDLVDDWSLAAAALQRGPPPGHALVLDHCRLLLARSVIDPAHDSYLASFAAWPDVAQRLRAAPSWTPELWQQLLALRAPLELKTSVRPPFPTSSDHYALGVLHLLAGEHERALHAFASAGRLVRGPAGLVARVEAMFALKRYDDVVATVIESETQDISVEDDKKRTGFAKKALQIMMRPGSEEMSEAGAAPVVATASEDQKQLQCIAVLRRALAYHALHQSSRDEVYRFKCAQDFALLFQSNDAKPPELNALLKGCKASITEDSETACALLHQASSLNPKCAVYPFMSARRRQPSDPRALVDINAALRLDAANVEYRVQRILSFVEQQRCSDALHEIHPIVINDSANVWYLYLRLRARAETGDLDGSIADAQRALTSLAGEALSPGLQRAKARLYYHIGCTLLRKLMADPNIARMGLALEIQKEAEEMLTQCITLDGPMLNAAAFRKRAELRLETSRLRDAAEDWLVYTQVLLTRFNDEHRDDATVAADVSGVAEECVRVLRKSDAHDLILQLAERAEGVYAELAPKLRGTWLFWRAYASQKMGDDSAGLALAEKALAAFAWEEGPEKARIVDLIVRCGGKTPEAVAQGSRRPTIVPALAIPAATTVRRRRTVTSSDVDAKPLEPGKSAGRRKSKSRKSSAKVVRSARAGSGSGSHSPSSVSMPLLASLPELATHGLVHSESSRESSRNASRNASRQASPAVSPRPIAEVDQSEKEQPLRDAPLDDAASGGPVLDHRTERERELEALVALLQAQLAEARAELASLRENKDAP